VMWQMPERVNVHTQL